MRSVVSIFFVLFVQLAVFAQGRSDLNLRPVIGVITQPTAQEGPDYQRLGTSYLSAAYVKWLEQGGARVVPVHYNSTVQELKTFFSVLSGLVLPGGDLDLKNSLYYNNSRLLFQWALQAADNGDYFPIWGTCQGFEELSMLASGNEDILSNFNAENMTLALNFTAEAPKSRLFGTAPSEIYDSFASLPITENLHQLGLSPAAFNTFPGLYSRFRVLSTNQDRDGKTFVSSMEGLKYPIYATQFHPERNQFEWDTEEVLVHSLAATQAMQYLSNFFVNECRRSSHQFDDTLHDSMLIYNYQPYYTITMDMYDTQTYFFRV